jgi:amidase/aspartyl-tRNA(Asn)/glutamyl-tRNA(Gln) amidotransferase subunit A
MDTNGPKTPATLPFAAWRSLPPAAAARLVHARLAALPENLRRAALAWLPTEPELAGQLASARVGPLQGIPYLLKDLFDLAGVPTQAGSTFLDAARGRPARDGALPARLRELGASCAGKTHLVEFAAGLFGDNSHYGDCPHPRDPHRLSGGSSSGSAALVGAGVVPLAIGTDTGGSVRVPASFCGVYGFRLSPGDTFIRDAMALASSLDTAGWFTATPADMLATCHALCGPGEISGGSRGAYLPAAAFGVAFEPATASAYQSAAAGLANPVDALAAASLVGAWSGAIEAYTTVALHEAHQIHRNWLAPWRAEYEPSIWQRFTDGGRYTEAQLTAARETFARVQRAFADFFTTHDFLILPATPFPALRKAECTPEARRALLTLTTPASLAGLPVLTIPVPLPNGLTTGLQVILPHARSAAIARLLNR